MRHTPTCRLFALVALLAGCAGNGDPQPTAAPTAEQTAPTPADDHAKAAAPAPKKVEAPPPDPLRHRDDLPPEQRVLVRVDGEPRMVDETAAREAGYSLVSLRNDWTPFIFEPQHDADGNELPNRYRRIYLGLANDQTDEDGRPLKGDEKNYLEVFGIPPSIGIIRDRFVTDADAKCHTAIDYRLMATLDEMTYRSDRSERSYKGKVRRWKKDIAKAAKKAKVDPTDTAAVQAANPELADRIANVHRYELEKAVLGEIDKRLTCDKHDNKRFRHKQGKLDRGLRLGIRRFQRKHKIYEHTNLRDQTMKTFATPPLQTNYDGFVRAFTERVVDAAAILEDGTAKPQTYVGADGREHQTRNLVDEFVTAALTQTGLDTPEKALAFFRKHPAEDFEWLRVGVLFPEKPEYYGPQMELDIVVDRGTVWYDLPFDETGKKVRQPRGRMPKLALYTTYRDQRIKLVRWPTTIGGWRTEQASNGYVYMKYKGSDVGNRVIRKIIAGPTWVPPESTPFKSLAKRRDVNGKRQSVVNYSEMGPGYLSAYGLVAGYFVIPTESGRDYDRGIRAHGSSDYMSIRSAQRFSHGCHRLMNHHAVRMYGFALRHRNMLVEGDQPMNHQRQFLFNEVVYHVRVPSRGFQYTLEPPIPVKVLKGSLRGDRLKPFEGYVKVPGKAYPGSMPGEGGGEDRAGGGDGAEEI